MRRSGRDTRNEIVENALQLFSVKGYHNTSINDLLDATGLTKGGLYGHFQGKEEVFAAAYERAVEIWRGIVFEGVMEVADPLERVKLVIRRDMFDYVGARVFKGGCFFLNLLVELSGQSVEMASRVYAGVEGFSGLIHRWLTEARDKGLLREEADLRAAADFIIVAVNGAAALFAASGDKKVLETTVSQVEAYIDSLKSSY